MLPAELRLLEFLGLPVVFKSATPKKRSDHHQEDLSKLSIWIRADTRGLLLLAEIPSCPDMAAQTRRQMDTLKSVLSWFDPMLRKT
jgi:hypothetical protein